MELRRIVATNNPSILKIHISNGCDVNETVLPHHETALAYAVKMCSIECVTILIDSKADINKQDSMGWTPLHMSTIWENERMTKLLIEKGAGLDIQKQDLMTPLFCAIVSKNLPCVQLLVEAKANLNIRDNHRRTSLRYAIEHKRDNITRYLIDVGAKLGGDYIMPEWVEELVLKRKNIKHALITFFALAKKTKVIHKDLVGEIVKMIWATKEEGEWSIPPQRGGMDPQKN